MFRFQLPIHRGVCEPPAGPCKWLRSQRSCVALVFVMLAAWPAARPASARTEDPYARFIARAEAVVIARVEQAGDVFVSRGSGSTRVFRARFGVERWVLGSDTARVLQFEMAPFTELAASLRRHPPGSQVLLYLLYMQSRWWIATDIAHAADEPVAGVESLSDVDAESRVASIQTAAARLSADSLACASDVIVVGVLLESAHTALPSWRFRVDSTIVGAVADTVVNVATERPLDLRRGRALLMLTHRADGTYEVVHGGLGVIYAADGVRRGTRTSLNQLMGRIVTARDARLGGGVTR